MHVAMYLVIDRTRGEAVLASKKRLSEVIHKSTSSITYALESGLIDLNGSTGELYCMRLGYNFYDVATGKLIAKHKRFSGDPKLDETGYTEGEMRRMLLNKKGYDGLKAKMVIFPDSKIDDFPSDLYDVFYDLDVIRTYRRDDYEWYEVEYDRKDRWYLNG